jgi:hypothetical protein
MNKSLNLLRNSVIFVWVLLKDCIVSKCTKKVKKIVEAKKTRKDWGNITISGSSPKNMGNISTEWIWNQ